MGEKHEVIPANLKMTKGEQVSSPQNEESKSSNMLAVIRTITKADIPYLVVDGALIFTTVGLLATCAAGKYHEITYGQDTHAKIRELSKLAQQDGFNRLTLDMGVDIGDKLTYPEAKVIMSVGNCAAYDVTIHYSTDAHDAPTDISSYELAPGRSWDGKTDIRAIQSTSEIRNGFYADCLAGAQ